MEIRQENIILHKADGTTSTTVITHIYAPHGHFLQGGWHIQLGSGVSPSDYTEVIDEGVTHEVPAFLPDVDIYDPESEDEEATIEDYEEVLAEIFGEGEDDESETDDPTDPDADSGSDPDSGTDDIPSA